VRAVAARNGRGQHLWRSRSNRQLRGGEFSKETACWDITEARRLFASRKDDVSTHVLKVAESRLTLLRSTENGHESLVKEHDPDYVLSGKDIYVLRFKAQYLNTSLNFASKEWMPGSVTWADCYEKAIDHVAVAAVQCCTRAQTLMDWHKHALGWTICCHIQERRSAWTISTANYHIRDVVVSCFLRRRRPSVDERARLKSDFRETGEMKTRKLVDKCEVIEKLKVANVSWRRNMDALRVFTY
jgi:hypothetical protein